MVWNGKAILLPYQHTYFIVILGILTCMILWDDYFEFCYIYEMILHFEKKKQEKCLDSVNCNPTSSTNFPILLYRSKKKPMAKIINQRNSRKKYYQGRGQVVLKMLSRKTRQK